MSGDWRTTAQAEIDGLSDTWIRKYGWDPVVEETDERIDLFVRMQAGSGRQYLLGLRYEADHLVVGRRESFHDPTSPDQAGEQFWPDEGGAFKKSREAICIPGTFGFHRILHAGEQNHPPSSTNLGELLSRIQQELKSR